MQKGHAENILHVPQVDAQRSWIQGLSHHPLPAQSSHLSAGALSEHPVSKLNVVRSSSSCFNYVNVKTRPIIF